MRLDDGKADYKEQVSRASADILRLGTGPLAELRRMMMEGPGVPAFWQVAAAGGFLDEKSRTGTWMRIVKIMAILTPKGERKNDDRLHDEGRRLGAVLCDGGDPNWKPEGGEPRPFLSELRFARFLSQPLEQRGDALERIARSLANRKNRDSGINCAEIAALLLFPEISYGLQDLARDYYKRLDSAARQSKQKEDVE
jgi:CRISPR system Cascade subunit CasB